MCQTLYPIRGQRLFLQVACLYQGPDFSPFLLSLLPEQRQGQTIVIGLFGELESTGSACRFQVLDRSLVFHLGQIWDSRPHTNWNGWGWGLHCHIFLHCHQPSISVQNWHSSEMRLLQEDTLSLELCQRLVSVTTGPPQESKEVYILFRDPYLMEHSFNFPHHCFSFLSKPEEYIQQSVRKIRTLQQFRKVLWHVEVQSKTIQIVFFLLW